jgi:Flp pilus assembly protein TadD
MMTGDWKEARLRIDEALQLVPNEPLIISLEGLLYALMGNRDVAIECVTRACSSPKSFGHAHHTYYQIACTLALTVETRGGF